ncbi:neprilysin-1-like [Amblyomma americanum]
MKLTAPIFVPKAETQSSIRSRLDSDVSAIAQEKDEAESGVAELSTLVICMFGVMSVLIVSSFVAIFTWYLAEFVITTPGLYYDDYDDYGGAGDSGDRDDYVDAEPSHDSDGRSDPKGPLPPRPVPPIDIRVVTVRRTVSSAATTSTPTARSPTSATRNPGPCSANDCRIQSDYLQLQLSFAADPCQDFYEFVCGNYRGHRLGPQYQAAKKIRVASILALAATPVQAASQSAWQKAAGLFQSCVAFTEAQRTQNDILEPWLTSLNLDPTNLTAPVKVDPVETMVRLALDLGFPAVFDFKLLDTSFIEGKRAMEFRTSDILETWLRKRDELLSQSDGPRILRSHFAGWFFIFPNFRNQTNVTALHGYDQKFVTTVRRHVKKATPFMTGAIKDMGSHTAPHVTSARWSYLLAKYTNGTYKADTKIRFQKELLQALAELLAAPDWGPRGLRAVMSWCFIEYFTPYTSGRQLVLMSNNRSRQEICYEHVSEIMEFAITSHLLRSRVSARALRQAAVMFSKVRDAFRRTLRGSTWLRGPARNVAVRKVEKIQAHIGCPGQRLDEAFVNQHYAGFEDITPTARFLHQWFKFRMARAHQKWADQTNAFFRIGRATVYYEHGDNVVIIPAGTLQPVFFFAGGSAALNYGSLGDALAHRIMNAFDITGIQYDDNGQVKPWNTPETQASYVNSTNCLRASHANAGGPNPQGSRLDDRVDSENMGDLVGAATAYQVASTQVYQTLPGLNLTTQQLYFVGRCMNLCRRNSSSPTGRFASPKARCNVPAMNMDAFSMAFGCPPGARMNPASKCSFWR